MAQTDFIGYFISIIIINALLLLFNSNGLHYLSSMISTNSRITRTINIGNIDQFFRVVILVFTIINIVCGIYFVSFLNKKIEFDALIDKPVDKIKEINDFKFGISVVAPAIATILILYIVISHIYEN